MFHRHQLPKRRNEQVGKAYPRLVVAACSLLVYALTLSPTIGGGDSGEIVVTSRQLAVPHPPGYPVIALLGHVFSWIPVGEVAWRVNLMSAVCHAAAAVVLFTIVDRATRHRPAACLSAGLFAFSPLVWRYSLVAEVFALNNLFVLLLLYFSLRFFQNRQLWDAYAGSLLFGLSLCNHHTIVFVAFPLICCVLWCGRATLLRPWPVSVLVVLFVVGLLPYAYLPLASAKLELVSWGDTTTWAGFVTHLIRREYGTFQLAPNAPASGPISSLRQYFCGHLPAQMLVVGPLLCVAGWVAAIKGRRLRQFGMASLCAFALYTLVFFHLANLPLEERLSHDVYSRFWLLPNAIAFIWFGIGFAYVARLAPIAFAVRIRGCATFIALVLVLVQLAFHYRKEDQSQNTLIRDLALQSLHAMPPNSVLFSRGDACVNALRYVREVEGRRRDVVMIPLDLATYPWLREILAKHFPNYQLPDGAYGGPNSVAGSLYSFRELLLANDSVCSHVFVTALYDEERAVIEAEYTVWPMAINVQVCRRDCFDFSDWYIRSKREIESIAQSLHRIPRRKSWEEHLLVRYWTNQVERVERIVEYSRDVGPTPEHVQAGEEALAQLVATNRFLDNAVQKRLARSLHELRMLTTPGHRATPAHDIGPEDRADAIEILSRASSISTNNVMR